MEQNPPVLAKKVWSLVRVVYLTLRKGITKKTLMLDLNMMVKRGKIAGKALQNVMFHHNHQYLAAFSSSRLSPPPAGEYEFSCTNSPTATLSSNVFSLFSKKHKPAEDLDMMAVNAAALKAMEVIHSETGSPELPGLGRSPVVRQLIRVTDSPFPMSGVDDDNHVDEAADRFINRFYDELRRENAKAARGSS